MNTKVTGDIEAEDIKIAGKVVGNVSAKSSVTLKENAVVVGNVSCAVISIEAGAKIDGNFKMITSEEKSQEGTGLPKDCLPTFLNLTKRR
jgi:cytoskeletal protein CcmA (bactofilin family)